MNDPIGVIHIYHLANDGVMFTNVETANVSTFSMPSKPIPINVLAENFSEFSGFRHIGSGSYKTVYEVTNTQGVKEVLKVIRIPQEGTSEEEEMFRNQELGRAQRETELLRDCSSEFIVKLGSLQPKLQTLENSDCVVYSEEFLPGQELKKLIKPGILPNDVEITRLLFCLVSAISCLWNEHKTVHRDIKPGNIIATGIAKRPYVLLDLGIAYSVTEPSLTFRPCDVPATPRYLAPEMLDPNFRENLSYRADLYTAGVTAFEFATGGTHPLARTADDQIMTISRILRQEPRRLASERSDLSQKLARLIDQLIKKNPALRPGSLPLLVKQLS